MGSKSKGRQEESALKQAALESKQKADSAIQTASNADPLEERLRARTTALDKWRMGESGPIDVRNMPGGGTAISLFNEAKQSRDAGRIGRGYGTLSDGANPNYSAALGKEMDLERDLNAAGGLENYVSNELNQNDARMAGLAGMGNSRNMNIAGMLNSDANSSQDRYMSYLTRPKPPSFLKQLALGAANMGMGFLTGGLLGGGGGHSSLASHTSPSHFAPQQTLMPHFKRGGSLNRYVGRPVVVGEDGPEAVVDEDGAEIVGQKGPGIIIPQRPGFVVPNSALKHRLLSI